MRSHTPRFLDAVTVTAALLIVGLSASRPVLAGCADGGPRMPKQAKTNLMPAIYFPDEQRNNVVRVADEDWQNHWDEHSIVGLWEFEVHLDDGTLFDWGLATWHDDGTEIQNSGARTPAAGDVCMGVWRRDGRSFKLNHIALGLTPPTANGQYVGPSQIHATVKLDESGTHYKGPYTLTVYPGSAANGTEFDTKGTPLAVFTGTFTAKRVMVDN